LKKRLKKYVEKEDFEYIQKTKLSNQNFEEYKQQLEEKICLMKLN